MALSWSFARSCPSDVKEGCIASATLPAVSHSASVSGPAIRVPKQKPDPSASPGGRLGEASPNPAKHRAVRYQVTSILILIPGIKLYLQNRRSMASRCCSPRDKTWLLDKSTRGRACVYIYIYTQSRGWELWTNQSRFGFDVACSQSICSENTPCGNLLLNTIVPCISWTEVEQTWRQRLMPDLDSRRGVRGQRSRAISAVPSRSKCPALDPGSRTGPQVGTPVGDYAL